MNIGVLISRFHGSQKSLEIINECNSFIQTGSIVGFFEEISFPTVPTLFPTMPANEIWGFDGPIIANDLKSAQSLYKLQTGHKKYFYIWDLEWIYMNNPNFEKLQTIYSNLNLICRCEDHQEIIKNLWNKEAKITHFNIEKII